jgi:hypothetical protein
VSTPIYPQESVEGSLEVRKESINTGHLGALSAIRANSATMPRTVHELCFAERRGPPNAQLKPTAPIHSRPATIPKSLFSASPASAQRTKQTRTTPRATR